MSANMLPDNYSDNDLHQLALTFVKGTGPKRARALLEHFGNAPDIFKAPLKELKNVDGLGEISARAFKDPEVMERARKEMDFVVKHGVQMLWIEDERYPKRLRNCIDAPILLYYKGNADLNMEKIVAVIGTRKNTDYGQRLTEELVQELAREENLTVVSGLAHGIDAIAHKQSVLSGVPTIGVMGNGIDMIYPANNKGLAKDMMAHGGVLTEFPSGTGPERTNFPMRNRVVAGMSDVTVVVESDIKGGGLITARIAASYNRDVAAFPGRVHDARSSGCNELIRTNTAAMITKADDLLDLMNWGKSKKRKAVQKQLFVQLTADEQKVVDQLQKRDSMHADELMYETGIQNSLLPAILLQLEMQGLVKALPGKQYRMN